MGTHDVLTKPITPDHAGELATNVRVDNLYSFGTKRALQRHGVIKLASELIPEYLLKQLRFELHMLFVRAMSWQARQMFRGQTNLMVNVGAGDVGRDGWVNLDGFKAKGITCVCDARKHLPLDNGSAKGIFTEHFFEHVDYTEEAPRFLQECLRVLQPGGIIRIIVPDASKYIAAFNSADWREFSIIRPLDAALKDHHFDFRYDTKMELMNVVFRQGYEHKFLYDFETLKLLLERNGFTKVCRQDFGQSLMSEICIDKPERASESLYVEAVRS